eukprot:1157895-Pelagomonas_calceolata.AAC.4
MASTLCTYVFAVMFPKNNSAAFPVVDVLPAAFPVVDGQENRHISHASFRCDVDGKVCTPNHGWEYPQNPALSSCALACTLLHVDYLEGIHALEVEASTPQRARDVALEAPGSRIWL